MFADQPELRFVLELVFRWMHILAAITLVGGTFMMRFAVLPAALTSLSDEQRQSFQAAMRAKWSKFVMAGAGFLLLSGLFNTALIMSNYKFPQGYYHALFGVKFLLAFVILYIASLLSGRSAVAEKFRQNQKKWLTLNAVLAIVLVLISGSLKVAKREQKPPKESAQSMQVEAAMQVEVSAKA